MGKGYLEDEMRGALAKRGGDNEPLHLKLAKWDGHRSIRLMMPQGDIGLATATYSYDLTHDERCDVAERLAALWNLGAELGVETPEIYATIENLRAKRRAS